MAIMSMSLSNTVLASSQKVMRPRRIAARAVSSPGNSARPSPQQHQQSVTSVAAITGSSVRLSHPAPTAASAVEASASAANPVEQASKCPIRQLTSAFSAASDSLPSTSVGVPSAATASSSSSSSSSSSELRPIPGPAPLSLAALQDVSIIFTQGLHVAMLAFSEKYGPVCRFANPASLNGATSWVFLNSPEAVQHVCATAVRNYGRRYLPDIYNYVTHGKGILGSQDEYNARHRRLCSGPFRNRAQLQRFSTVVVERSHQLADIWMEAVEAAGARSSPSPSVSSPSPSVSPSPSPSVSSGGGCLVTDVAVHSQRLTLDIVGLVAFSHDFRQVEQVSRDLGGSAADPRLLPDRVLWAVNTFGQVLADIFITPLPLLRLLDALGLPHLRRLDEAVGVMRAAMLEVIQERRTALSSGLPGKDDLLQALLTATDEVGRGLTDEELWEDVHDIMGAGHETTATTTAALLYCISAHPDVRQRVEAELDQVLAGQPPSFEALEHMPYLQCCVKEVMRLYPAIPVFPREALRDDELPSGHVINAGDVVFMSSYALGRSAALWPDPLTFNPDRFSPEAEAAHHRFQWLPFGAGPRMCLGASFAQMSVSLMAATLLQRFRFTPLHPSSRLIPVAYDITMNFNPSGGLRMKVQPR
ncbi:hypothetical protein PLESTB_001835900 [Pleodorina starrii]|uniref:Cytochrome P450 n=1 Tax=Pleodorina starrii TaxID=330485 RepID=A0A9W6FAU6_9CHLO|nr:hypothetical protein PLESTM_002052000 [Pleodorina starrii]GLC62056.1 hypothetical protein PLESTB_001835900 [Pleodorina starrii]GLC65640.1 hypothetical protein PLESTF_000321800 [Pleodorina starrii]